MTEYETWFGKVTRHSAGSHRWQTELALDSTCRDRLIRIPTGMGKTAGTALAWMWNRVVRMDPSWPRRLVICLPMRVLVEQTEAEIRGWLDGEERLWKSGEPHEGKVGVHLLMGGAEPEEWHLWPEHEAVLIGTQDMLLSRALNRGYAAARARWPIDFGLLNQDALWVMDEIQLMDVGLATSAQLQAFRHDDANAGKQIRPCRTWWMSATLQPAWLESVDTKSLVASLPIAQIGKTERAGGLWEVRKSCSVEIATEPEALARLVIDKHQPSSLTLVVVNRVDTAVTVHRHLQALLDRGQTDLRLVHSRFRPAERAGWRGEFLTKSAVVPAGGRIIVATQVVEAGVDISARTVVTELAPWSSLVQRFGRCARYQEETGQVFVIDRGWSEKNAKNALPYDLDELNQAKEALKTLDDVSPASLEDFEAGLAPAAKSGLYPYKPRHLLLRREWDELFDTTPDLSGADIDISRFIRSGDELDCLVFWREIPEKRQPDDDLQPSRAELCPVQFHRTRDWLCGPETKGSAPQKLKQKMRAWVWDWLDGEWKRDTRRGDLLPGRIVLVASDCGGYRTESGWDPGVDDPVRPVPATPVPPQEQADAAQSREDLSEAAWKTIATHDAETASLAKELAGAIGLGLDDVRICEMAGLWHDVGKVHPCFQGSMRLPGQRPARQDLAKAPKPAWSRKYLYRSEVQPEDHRPGLRHEMASALALFTALLENQPDHPALHPRPCDLDESLPQPTGTSRAPTAWEKALSELDPASFNLLAYLVASHHGKVRMSLHASPADQDYRNQDGRGLPLRGVREGDVLPPISGAEDAVLIGRTALSLEPAYLGLSERTGPSWTERMLDLLRTRGPGALALLEAIIRAADVRASRAGTPDPLLTKKEGSR